MSLSLEQGIRAYEGISFSPEKRAKEDLQAIEADVSELRTALNLVCETPKQREIAEAEIERFRAAYEKHMSAIWSARSRCLSSAITGPSNFPTRRNEKRLETERRRVKEFLEWLPKARGSAYKAVQGARTADQVESADWLDLKKHIDRDIDIVRRIDAGIEPYSRSAFTSSAQGKIERLAANGRTDMVIRALAYVREAQTGWRKPFFVERNSVWQLAESAAKVEARPAPSGEEIIGETETVRVVNNRDAERVQLYFATRPDSETIRLLKSSGWRWSPSNGAWQRQNTSNGIYSARGFLNRSTP